MVSSRESLSPGFEPAPSPVRLARPLTRQPSIMADSQINLLVWSGDRAQARRAVGERYPGSEVTEIPKRALRESGWKGQLRYMLRLRGQALIIYCASLDDVQAPRLFACVH